MEDLVLKVFNAFPPFQKCSGDFCKGLQWWMQKFASVIAKNDPSLGRLATTFGKLGISLVYGEAMTVEKDKTAIWTVIGPRPESIDLENLKERLIDEGGALEVEISPLE